MKRSLTLFLLILFLVFVSCGGFLESFESEENKGHLQKRVDSIAQ